MNKEDKTDDVLYGKLKILQPEEGPRVNVDTILLSAFAKIKQGEKALELGSAHGAVSLILGLRFPFVSGITGLELQEDLVHMSRTNATLNGLEKLVEFRKGDLKDIRSIFPAQSFDVVVANPPYFEYSSKRQSDSRSRALANHETECSLADVLDASKHLLKNRGGFYMIMRTSRLSELLALLLDKSLEPKLVRPVYPSKNKASNVVLVYSCKNAGKGLQMKEPLFIYDENGEYSSEFLNAYDLGESPCL